MISKDCEFSMLKTRGFSKVFCISILLAAGTLLKADEITSYPARAVISVDGVAADWADMESYPLPGGVGNVKIAHSPERLYLLLQTKDPELAYLVLCQGLGVWIDLEAGQNKNCGLRYAGSKKLAQEIETNHNPLPKDNEGKDGERFEPPSIGTRTPGQPPPPGSGLPPEPPAGGMPPAGRGDPRVKQVFKKIADPGILLVTKGRQESMQMECLKNCPCAASGYDNQMFSYEFSFPSDELPAGLAPLGSGNVRKINLGIQLPELRPDREIVETQAPSGGQMGGPGGMGGGPGGAGGGRPGMGGGPGGAGGKGPGDGGGHGPSAGPKEGPSYSIAVNTHWYAVIVAPEESKNATSR
jgi:hypothetical protein